MENKGGGGEEQEGDEDEEGEAEGDEASQEESQTRDSANITKLGKGRTSLRLYTGVEKGAPSLARQAGPRPSITA